MPFNKKKAHLALQDGLSAPRTRCDGDTSSSDDLRDIIILNPIALTRRIVDGVMHIELLRDEDLYGVGMVSIARLYDDALYHQVVHIGAVNQADADDRIHLIAGLQPLYHFHSRQSERFFCDDDDFILHDTLLLQGRIRQLFPD